jgi:hypothetical protein
MRDGLRNHLEPDPVIGVEVRHRQLRQAVLVCSRQVIGQNQGSALGAVAARVNQHNRGP